MNFNTLSGSAKLYKKLGTYATGQLVTSGETPNIAILAAVNAFEHKRLVESVGYGIRSKGGLVNVHYVQPFGFMNKTNPMTAKYTESFKRMTASMSEAIIKTNLIDGIVIVTDCDITAAGLLCGAARANCPTLILPVGISANLDTEILKIAGAVTAGKLNGRESEQIIKNAHLSRGTSNSLNSISTFFVLAEAMGFCIPSASTNLVESSAQYRCAVETGEQICQNAKDILAPKKFLTRGALSNITALCLAIGGSISALHTITSMVHLYESKIPHTLMHDISAKTPLLFPAENQTCTHISKFGTTAILKLLSSTPKFIDENMLSCRGEKLKIILPTIDMPKIEPVSKTARIILVKGNACEQGGYAQPTEQTPSCVSGKAWVYQGLEEADKALLSGSIPDQSIVVVHNCTDTYVTSLAYAIEGMNKQNEIAIITDGICEKTSALVVTRCTPNSLMNEEFANIQNGDQLDIDLARGRITTNILSKDQKTRQKRNSVKKPTVYFA